MDRGHRPRSRCKRLRRRWAWWWTRQGGVDRPADLGGRGQGHLAGTLCGGRIEDIAEAAAVAGNALAADACLALAAGAPPLVEVLSLTVTFVSVSDTASASVNVTEPLPFAAVVDTWPRSRLNEPVPTSTPLSASKATVPLLAPATAVIVRALPFGSVSLARSVVTGMVSA